MSTNTNLCLACSSSLPPKSYESAFHTKCCRRPICPACLSSNPRLARYDPCLACLSGVGVVGNSGTAAQSSTLSTPVNIDGGLKDEDTFVLGSDDDDDEDDEDARGPPPAYEQVEPAPSSAIIAPETAPADAQDAQPDSPDVRHEADGPLKYYLKRGDTLQGISFKFSVDGRELCKLNTLPPSTLSTTPHLLHTRTFLVLPPSARGKLAASQTPQEAAQHEARRARQRAEKRLQTLTKEADWRVARAYIALADGDDAEREAKMKEMGTGLNSDSCASTSRLERYAVEQYLEDDEWEASERRAGRQPRLPSLPSSSAAPPKDRHWWER
ncbi:hypothetical protein K523DRAFT_284622 [Schizophyllum commune Tattone D]|nr:hypothetical protein K523DRAFT_284622 [Schizophyllum commune Tattone D]